MANRHDFTYHLAFTICRITTRDSKHFFKYVLAAFLRYHMLQKPA